MSGLFRSIGNLFSGDAPKMEPPPPPPSVPTVDEAAKAREAEDQRRRRRGRAATILTGPQGAGTPRSAAKTLTGE